MSALSPLSDAFRYRRAASISRRLTTTRPDCYRIIPREPPSGNDFAAAVAEKLTEANSELWNASILWELQQPSGELVKKRPDRYAQPLIRIRRNSHDDSRKE
jgi:hypothetical protein